MLAGLADGERFSYFLITFVALNSIQNDQFPANNLVPESWRKGVKMAEPNRQSGENEERIIEIEIERLRPFKEHPFQVKDRLYAEPRYDDDQCTGLL